MLKQRILTALILIPLVLILLYYGSSWIQLSLMLLLTMFMGGEWIQLLPIENIKYKALFIIGLLICIGVSFFWFMSFFWVGFLLWFFIILAILTFPDSQVYWGKKPIVAVFCFLLLPTFLSSLVAIYQFKQGKDLILYLLCLIWATDIGAYFFGKLYGRHKLIVQVSPGKTIEGSVGGVVLAMLIALLGYVYFNPPSILAWFELALSTILLCIFGDLFISMLKRRVVIKDTGQMLPGHGGVLDRLDSLIAACPIFYFGILSFDSLHKVF